MKLAECTTERLIGQQVRWNIYLQINNVIRLEIINHNWSQISDQVWYQLNDEIKVKINSEMLSIRKSIYLQIDELNQL